ncbi:induced myeloid leukemia cell differentiation protein Mcl-1 homolog [Scleropages formosus]|uniref:MCL1 apoptosis regulator, BCL2 family member b n=1 Tax=Scleropages formosus TaxID=113540 RepID=A0A8C9VMU9_SCLFO|nr:induced myeloid leukemia cell differentiation protein Mcl-1 homolog [Scleropages formosus]
MWTASSYKCRDETLSVNGLYMFNNSFFPKMSQSMMKPPHTSFMDICCPGNKARGGGTNYQDGSDKAPQVALASEVEDELLYGLDEVDSCLRSPKTGGKGTPKKLVLERLVPKSRSGGVEDNGSLPCTPGNSPTTECGQMCEFHDNHGDELLERETHELLGDFLLLYAGMFQGKPRRSRALRTMQRVVEDVLLKHRFTYKGMISKQRLEQESDDMGFIKAVAQNLFSDQVTNWGRIVGLVAFGAEVSKHLKESGREHCIGTVGAQISTYLLTEQREWLLNNKAWEGFVEFFTIEDAESVVRNSLLAFATMAWIGLGIAYFMK